MKHAEPVNADSSVSIALFLKQCYNTIYNYNVARANLESVIALPQQVTKTLEGKKKNGRKK